MHKLDRRGVIPHIELILAVAVIVAVGFAVIRIMDANSNPVASETSDSPSTELDLASISLDDVVDLETVKQAALVENDGATVLSYELESEDGVLVYKIHLDNGLELYFNATTGELIKTETSDDTDNDNQPLPANFVAGITFSEARQIAQAERPGKTIEKIQLEVEDGEVVYSVRFQDDGRVDVNAATGDIVEIRQEGGERTFEDDDDNSSDDDSSSDDDDSSDDSDDSEDDDEDDDSDDDDVDNSGSGSSN